MNHIDYTVYQKSRQHHIGKELFNEMNRVMGILHEAHQHTTDPQMVQYLLKLETHLVCIDLLLCIDVLGQSNTRAVGESNDAS